MSDDARATCPECGKTAVRLLSGGAGLIFKGEGFYITDYRSEAYKKAASSDKEAASPEKKASSGDAEKKSSGGADSSDGSGGGASGGGASGGPSDGGSSKSKRTSADVARASGGSKSSDAGKSS